VSGCDLQSPDHSWPALIARDLSLPCRNYARAGVGNLKILESILAVARPNSLCVVSWTWIDRFDFINSAVESWETLRPALDHPHADHYFRNLHSQYRDTLTSLIYVSQAIDYFQTNNIPFLMTCIDRLILAPVDAKWHDPRPIEALQRKINNHIKYFEDMDFVQWAEHKKFAISSTLHPLQDAHRAAADIMKPHIQQLLS
jgi:hypothetical protein